MSERNINNRIKHMFDQLRRLNAKVINAKQIRNSAITHWLRTNHLRQVQYMAGHKYVSSTERYQLNNLDDLQPELRVPKQLALLCYLLETTPEEVLQGFINDLSQEVHYSNGSDERLMAVEYFLRVGYGTHCYEWEQIEQMFDGLNWLRWQWPGNDAEKEKQYLRERRVFLRQWFRQWKAKRKTQ